MTNKNGKSTADEIDEAVDSFELDLGESEDSDASKASPQNLGMESHDLEGSELALESSEDSSESSKDPLEELESEPKDLEDVKGLSAEGSGPKLADQALALDEEPLEGTEGGLQGEFDEDLSSLFEGVDPSDTTDITSTEELRQLDLMESLSFEAQVEAIVFASPKPIKSQDIQSLLSDEKQDISVKQVEEVLHQLVSLYEERAGGFKLVYEPGIGYQFQSIAAASYLMERMFSSRPRPLSRAALETLSIIAYRQPSTRAEIEYIRGVDAGSIIKNLLDRGLIDCVGRKEDAGRPMLFGTTAEFLKVFRVDSLEQLPPLAAFQPSAETAEAASKEAEDAVNVEGFIGDEEQEDPDVSEGLREAPDNLTETTELSGPSADKALEDDDSIDLQFDSDEESEMRLGASKKEANQGIAEGKHGATEVTEMDIPTGTSVEAGSREVDSGGES